MTVFAMMGAPRSCDDEGGDGGLVFGDAPR